MFYFFLEIYKIEVIIGIFYGKEILNCILCKYVCKVGLYKEFYKIVVLYI